MHELNADLHCHSTVSDGTLSPRQLAERAKANGVALWALTDHDELAGQPEAAAAARALQLDYLAGVEISVSFADQTVHVVGLGIDPDNTALRAGLAHTRGSRGRRAKAIGEALAAIGIDGAYDGAEALAENPDMVTRTHFARWLVFTGVCRDLHDVFRNYLTRGKPGHVPEQWASLHDAVAWIVGAGGVAVIAHPARYKYSANEEWALFQQFKAHGGRGVEVLTASHSSADVAKYADTARELDLLASRGSDFHAPGESRIELGALPALPKGLTPVWSELQGRVQRA
ncbi:MAG TPA: 3',5'-nucleoside bisphosphate phosphatase [Burkholderiaceae bacterium]|nr:3',5'-nucleoside bisphosphate phosphatase [Burkholderiaceae bacterium]